MDSSEEYSRRGYGYMCNICSVFLNTDKVLQDHLKGKKHQKVLGLRKSWRQQEERSIFVGGFHKGTSELQLIDYFSNYGPVENVIFDKDKGKYAIVELGSQEVAENVLSEKEHKLGEHKLIVKPRQRKEFIPKSKSKQAKNQKQKEDEKRNVQEELKQVLKKETSMSGQMEVLMKHLQLTKEDVKLRYLICNLLQEIFQEFFPGCLVFPYGSSVNGFGSPGCDLDLQLELNGKDCQYRFKKVPSDSPEVAAGSSNTEGDAGNTSSGEINEPTGISDDVEEEGGFDIDGADPEDLMELIVKIIKKCAPGCKQVKAITARCPVVKFVHAESGMACDISINNRLAMENTELLYMYGDLDERVRPLVYTVRHWAKQKLLAGNDNYAGPRLSNYALTLMVIFFLQQTETSVVPTVDQLQRACNESEVLTINGWNASFSRNFAESSNKKTSKSPDELLCDFFKFYAEFDFASFVICPLTGRPLSLDKVRKQPLPENKQKFKFTPLCVQDPFELNHNIAMNVNATVLQSFVQEMESVRHLFDLGKFNFPKSASGNRQENVGLLKLFANEGKSKKLSESGSAVADKDCTILVALQQSKVPECVLKQYSDVEELKIVWFSKVVEFFQVILEDVLMMECETEHLGVDGSAGKKVTGKGGEDEPTKGKVDNPDLVNLEERSLEKDSQPQKKRRVESEESMVEESAGSTGTSSQHVEMLCTSAHHLWLGRRKVRRQLQQRQKEKEGLEFEKAVSLEMQRLELQQKEVRETVEFRVIFAWETKDMQNSVRIRFLPLKGEEFQNFFHFIELFFPKMLESHGLKDLS